MGKGSDFVRLQALTQIKADQQQIYSTMGPNNPFVSPVEMWNTMSDMLELANIKDIERYFKMPTPEVLQAIASAPTQPDPMAVSAQAQMEDVRRKTAESVSKQAQEDDKIHQKAIADARKDDLARDKAMIDSVTKLTIAGMQQETAKVEAENTPNAGD
jgi:hypothetical protein